VPALAYHCITATDDEHAQADIRDTAMFTAAITRAAKELGGAPDILVNNAGINLPARLVDLQGRAEVTKEAMDAIFGVNVYGTVLTSQTFARFLLKAGKPGVILNISSESGEHGSIGALQGKLSRHSGASFANDGLTPSGRIRAGDLLSKQGEH